MSTVEWLFSGVGVKIGEYFLKLLFGKQRHEEDVAPQVTVCEKVDECVAEVGVDEHTEAQSVSIRLKRSFDLINEANRYNSYSYADFAQQLCLKRVSDFEDYVLGVKEPDFDFMKLYSSEFNVNYEWLTAGRRLPFSTTVEHGFDPCDYLDLIQDSAPERVYFVKCKTERAEMFIALKYSDLKYAICPKIWHISSCVGAGGAGQIHNLYIMIKKLKETGLYSRCWGVLLSKNEFDDLYDGQYFPGKVLGHKRANFWFDDFADVYHKDSTEEQYRQMHGEEFVHAQGIVRSGEEYYGEKRRKSPTP